MTALGGAGADIALIGNTWDISYLTESSNATRYRLPFTFKAITDHVMEQSGESSHDKAIDRWANDNFYASKNFITSQYKLD